MENDDFFNDIKNLYSSYDTPAPDAPPDEDEYFGEMRRLFTSVSDGQFSSPLDDTRQTHSAPTTPSPVIKTVGPPTHPASTGRKFPLIGKDKRPSREEDDTTDLKPVKTSGRYTISFFCFD
jgi:hypothetical protein